MHSFFLDGNYGNTAENIFCQQKPISIFHKYFTFELLK